MCRLLCAIKYVDRRTEIVYPECILIVQYMQRTCNINYLVVVIEINNSMKQSPLETQKKMCFSYAIHSFITVLKR